MSDTPKNSTPIAEATPSAPDRGRELSAPPRVPSANKTLDPLTVRENIFAQWFVETRNVMQAYRQAYDVPPHLKSAQVYREACDVLRRPHVTAKCREMQDELNAQTIVRAVEILQDCVDIYTADPNELVKLERYNCRNCNGAGFRYQWRDALELAAAMDAYGRSLAEYNAFKPSKGAKRPPRPGVPPDASGGFGYDHKAEVHTACPQCYGEGIVRSVVQDTTKLSPRARKLYKGVEVKANGEVKVLMHDQMQARDMAVKMLGAYKDTGKGGSLGGTNEPKFIDEGVTPEAAQQAYLRLVGR